MAKGSKRIDKMAGAIRESSATDQIFPQDRMARYSDHYPPGSDDDAFFKFTSAFVYAARSWRRLVDEKLRSIGQTQARWETLFILSFADRRVTQQELARLIGITAPTLIQMLQTLEGDGLIKRLPDRSDGRLTENRITAKGQRVVREIQAITDELRQELLGMLDTTEILHAARLLSVVNARLDGRGSHGAETPRGENHTID